MTTPTPDEQAFLAAYNPHKFEPFAVTADIVILTIRNGQLCVLLIERADHPFKGAWALPGGFVDAAEDPDDAAWRELEEETGLTRAELEQASHLEQLRTYGQPNRDPRMRVVSVAYLAFLPDVNTPVAGSDAAQARFWPIDDLRGDDAPALAFDHEQIIADGVERARAKLEYSTLATSFLTGDFTISDLRRVYEAAWGVALEPNNFRRKVLSTDAFVVDTGTTQGRDRGRPVSLYRAGAATVLHPPILRPTPEAA